MTLFTNKFSKDGRPKEATALGNLVCISVIVQNRRWLSL